ncbi:O-glucosyltransferase rumi [Dorcoceras hygrometricum]|uniref:O-glucosyltransferase rumi n=1 Tax=Dorcoceras hygrometricum TaxID=472368 RepID=A0A2Z7DF19_9LAMI|nr:O-glucosyltransferase rumi [Dorcoceras hygrometricum]
MVTVACSCWCIATTSFELVKRRVLDCCDWMLRLGDQLWIEEPVEGATRRRLDKLKRCVSRICVWYQFCWSETASFCLVATMSSGCCDWFVEGNISTSRKIPTIHVDWIGEQQSRDSRCTYIEIRFTSFNGRFRGLMVELLTQINAYVDDFVTVDVIKGIKGLNGGRSNPLLATYKYPIEIAGIFPHHFEILSQKSSRILSQNPAQIATCSKNCY